MAEKMQGVKTVLLTGVAGFVGTNLAISLIRKGYSVIGVDISNRHNRLSSSGLLTKKAFKFVQGDLTNERISDKFLEITNHIDVIIHLAALPHVDYSMCFPNETISNNVHTTLNIARFASKNKIPLIFSSSVEVYGGRDSSLPFLESESLFPKSPYGGSKILCEIILQAYKESFHLEYTILRFTNIFGPWQAPDRLVSRVIAQSLLEIKATIEKGTFRDFISINSVCDVVTKIIEKERHSGETYNLSTGNGYDNISIMKYLNSLLPNINCSLVNRRETDGRGKYLISSPRKLEMFLGESMSHLTKDLIVSLGETVDWFSSHEQWLDNFSMNLKSNRDEGNFLTDVKPKWKNT